MSGIKGAKFLYETPQVGVSIWIKSTASIAGSGLNSEPQNNEYRIYERSCCP